MSEYGRRTKCQMFLNCDAILAENRNLKYVKKFRQFPTPIVSKKRLKPIEALTKIWMNPSNEILKDVVPNPDHSFAKATIKAKQTTKDKEKVIEQSELLIKRYLVLNEYPISDMTVTKSSEAETVYSDYALDELPLNVSLPIEDINTDVASEYSDEVLFKPRKIKRQSQEVRLKKLLQQEKRIYKEKVKELYAKEFARQAEIIETNASIELDTKLGSTLHQIRKDVSKEALEDLQPVAAFIKWYKKEVMYEFFDRTNKRYRERRNEGIMSVIRNMDNQLSFNCLSAEGNLRRLYNYKSKYSECATREKYMNTVNVEKQRWMKIVNVKRAELLEERDKAIDALRTEYKEQFQKISTEENKIFEVEFDKVKQEEENYQMNQRITVQRNRIDTFLTDAVRREWEEESWICIVKKLLKEIQIFINNFIDPSGETSFIKVYNEIKLKKEATAKESLIASIISTSDGSSSDDLENVIRCCPPNEFQSKIDRKEYRELIKIAASLLNSLVSNAVKLSKAREIENKEIKVKPSKAVSQEERSLIASHGITDIIVKSSDTERMTSAFDATAGSPSQTRAMKEDVLDAMSTRGTINQFTGDEPDLFYSHIYRHHSNAIASISGKSPPVSIISSAHSAFVSMKNSSLK